jgi:hypothetical protein
MEESGEQVGNRATSMEVKLQMEIPNGHYHTVERMTDLPAEVCCQHIAHLAERLSQGQLTVQHGVLLMCDDLLRVCAHCWNVLDGESFDLSPMASRGHPIRYLTPQDGEEFQFYFEQAGQWSEKSKEDFDADVDILLASHGYKTSLTPKLD